MLAVTYFIQHRYHRSSSASSITCISDHHNHWGYHHHHHHHHHQSRHRRSWFIDDHQHRPKHDHRTSASSAIIIIEHQSISPIISIMNHSLTWAIIKLSIITIDPHFHQSSITIIIEQCAAKENIKWGVLQVESLPSQIAMHENLQVCVGHHLTLSCDILDTYSTTKVDAFIPRSQLHCSDADTSFALQIGAAINRPIPINLEVAASQIDQHKMRSSLYSSRF